MIRENVLYFKHTLSIHEGVVSAISVFKFNIHGVFVWLGFITRLMYGHFPYMGLFFIVKIEREF